MNIKNKYIRQEEYGKRKEKAVIEEVERRIDKDKDSRKPVIDNEIYGVHRHKERGSREQENASNGQRMILEANNRNKYKQ